MQYTSDGNILGSSSVAIDYWHQRLEAKRDAQSEGLASSNTQYTSDANVLGRSSVAMVEEPAPSVGNARA